MRLQSQVKINAPAENIWPLFLEAEMDERLPFVFRLGLPKAVSCSIIEGDGSVGSKRRCITTRGYMDQHIDISEKPHRFGYHLTESNYWGNPFIREVRDDIRLRPTDDGGTEVLRETQFSAKGLLAIFATPVMWLGFVFAHKYANENWKRLAENNAHTNSP